MDSDTIDSLLGKARQDIAAAADARALEQLRVDLLGKKGRVTELLKQLGTMAHDQRKAFGERVNRARDEVAGLLWDPLESTCRHASLSIL